MLHFDYLKKANFHATKPTAEDNFSIEIYNNLYMIVTIREIKKKPPRHYGSLDIGPDAAPS